MDVLQAIHARRAVRAYTEEPVGEATVRALLGAAVDAPSAMNRQPWRFAVVQDRARLKRYSEEAKALLLAGARDEKSRRYEALLRDPAFDVFYGAGTLIAIGTEDRGPYTAADCWLAAQNLMLAAFDRGLGTCPIGFTVPLLNTPQVLQEIGMPPGGEIVAPIIVGHPQAPAPPVPRSVPHVVAWIR